MKVKENDVKAAVKHYLDLSGWFHFHLLAGMGSYHGAPDRIAIKNGNVLFLEIKRPGGKQSEHQFKFQAMIESKNGHYLCIDNIEDLEKYIVEHFGERSLLL